MSKYTTELRFICENYAGLDESAERDSVKGIISVARPKVFDFEYPIFDATYRPVLETKIIRHFYTREICAETVGLWKLWLESKMNEIMPYYNELYKSALIEYNPLYDTDYKVDHNGGSVSNGTNDSKSFTKGGGTDTTINKVNSRAGGEDRNNYNRRDKFNEWNLYSDTPQGGINGIANAEDDPALGTDAYLTNATHVLHDGDGTNGTSVNQYGRTDDTNGTSQTEYGRTTDTTGNNKSNIETTDKYVDIVTGKRGNKTYPAMIKEFRDNIINIDMMVINELNDLFFNLW